MSLRDFIMTNVNTARALTREDVSRPADGNGHTSSAQTGGLAGSSPAPGIPIPEQTETEWLLSLPLAERVDMCLQLGRRDVPVLPEEKVEITAELSDRSKPGLVVYEDRPVETPMTHEALAALARPHEPREGEVTADHVTAWLKEKS